MIPASTKYFPNSGQILRKRRRCSSVQKPIHIPLPRGYTNSGRRCLRLQTSAFECSKARPARLDSSPVRAYPRGKLQIVQRRTGPVLWERNGARESATLKESTAGACGSLRSQRRTLARESEAAYCQKKQSSLLVFIWGARKRSWTLSRSKC